MTFKLIKLKDKDNHFDNYDVEITGDITTLSEALELYQRFLQACGFVVNGEFVVMEYEDFRQGPEKEDEHQNRYENQDEINAEAAEENYRLVKEAIADWGRPTILKDLYNNDYKRWADNLLYTLIHELGLVNLKLPGSKESENET